MAGTLTADQLNAIAKQSGYTGGTFGTTGLTTTPQVSNQSLGLPPAITPQSLSSTEKPIDVPPAPNVTTPDTTNLADLLAKFSAGSAETQAKQTEKKSALDYLQGLYDKAGTEAARKNELSAQAGLPDLQKTSNELIQAIRQNNLGAFTATQNSENRQAPTFAITGEQAQIERQRAVKNYALAATVEAVNGNIALAQQNIQNALDAEFKPLESQIEYGKLLLQNASENLTAEQKKDADKLSILLDERSRLLTEQKDNKNLILQYVGAAAQNSNNPAPSALIHQALEMKDPAQAFNLLAPYFKDPLAAQKALADLELTKAQTAKTYADAKGNSFVTGGTPSQQAYFNAFNNAVLGLPSVNAQKTAANTFAQYMNNGDTEGARNYLVSVATQGLPSQERTATIGRAVATASLNDIASLIQEAQSLGAGPNLVSGTIANIGNSLGLSTNPQLQYIGARIQQQLQVYRRQMTGVAFSPEESEEYKKIFPDITNVESLNLTKIQALKDAFNSNNRAQLSVLLGGDSNYNSVFGVPPTATFPTNTGGLSPEKQSIYDSIVNSGGSDGTNDYSFGTSLTKILNDLFGGF